MSRFAVSGLVAMAGLLTGMATAFAEHSPPTPSPEIATRSFPAEGVIKEVEAGTRTAVIRHEAIADYMPAMTMRFKVIEANELEGLKPGGRVSFRLNVTEDESWIDQITPISPPLEVASSPVPAPTPSPRPANRPDHPLLHFQFTNELGQAVSLSDFHGQALAITFFFTRCPIPEYCPRLSKNFSAASRKLLAITNAPANWHFLSVSFDTDYDSPAVLKAYGDTYHYNARHWSFLTGPADKIRELAGLSNVQFKADQGFFDHNFRTLIIDAAGRLQMTFPVGGDLSDAIVSEILKAAAVTNKST